MERVTLAHLWWEKLLEWLNPCGFSFKGINCWIYGNCSLPCSINLAHEVLFQKPENKETAFCLDSTRKSIAKKAPSLKISLDIWAYLYNTFFAFSKYQHFKRSFEDSSASSRLQGGSVRVYKGRWVSFIPPWEFYWKNPPGDSISKCKNKLLCLLSWAAKTEWAFRSTSGEKILSHLTIEVFQNCFQLCVSVSFQDRCCLRHKNGSVVAGGWVPGIWKEVNSIQRRTNKQTFKKNPD